MNWIIFTLLAVLFQTFRNAFQSQLSSSVKTAGVTLSRFLFAPPLAGFYLWLLYHQLPAELPSYSMRFWVIVSFAAVLQIAATSLMVILFKQKNFAVGAGLAKSEALAAGILGTLFFGSQLSLLGWAGIAIGSIAVFILSGVKRGGDISFRTALIGVCSGFCFAMTSLLVREASQTFTIPVYHSAGWVLLWVLCIQTLLLCVYIGIKQPQTFLQLKSRLTLTLATSVTSCVGSICWFTAMALQHVAYVKTLGQLEVLTTIAISVFWLKKSVARHEITGLLLIGLAAILVMWV